MILHCNLDLEDTKPIYLENNPAHNDALPCHVRGEVIQKVSPGQTFINILKFVVTLTLNTTTLFFQKTFWLMITYHQTKFGSKRISSSADIAETVIF